MKRILPLPSGSMVLIGFLILFFFSSSLFAQITHNVTVSNFQFSPSTLTINTGDMVVWTNTGGSHNVNGTMATFPSNPVGFGNSIGSGWVYSFTFNVAGSYSFRCDQHPSTMLGSITVVNPSGIAEASIPSLKVYPNPANDKFSVSMNNAMFKGVDMIVMDLFSVSGQRIKQVEIYKSPELRSNIDISDIPAGLYIYQFTSQENKPIIGKLIIR